ncbi:MAG TPA: penicillin-binding protein 2 [Acidimicrobiales bacterium]|nr:penicillin-binding protein 2 [Acidimicrobiales bacterium]
MSLVGMSVAFLAIAARLAYLQGPGAGRYLAVGVSEWTHTVTLAASRGAILDDRGDELAMSLPQTTIYADPHQVADPRSEAAALAGALGQPADKLLAALTENAGFVYLARTVPDATAAAVKKLDLPGIYSLQEPKRYYPAGPLASPLLGTVGTDGSGLGGLESMYNSVLEGRPGQLIEQTDPQGRQLPGGLQQYRAPVPGSDLVLTVDQSLQYDTEQALAQAIVAAKAKSGIAMLMDTKTGDILADANLAMPSTDNPNTTPAVALQLPTVTGPASGTNTGGASTAGGEPVEAASASSFTQVYEPGSVNKLITISAALQDGVIAPSDTFTIPNGYDVAGTTFHDAEPHATEHWSVTDILANSSNIGTIQIAQKLGRAKLLDAIAAYGEGERTTIRFPGESQGLLPTYWSGTSIADVPIGQGIGVTAVQMLAAYNTIANHGVYVAPRLVDGIIGPDGTERGLPAAPTHRVVTPTVAAEMTTMLDEVVRVGTGTAADLSPYTVAGKTGTALVPSPKGGYEPGHYVASFAGFVPAEDPAITAMVVINDTPDFGAAASAPTFATIARDALQARKVPPHAPVPPAPGVPLATAQSATGAGEVAGTPLPGLSAPAVVAITPPAAGSGTTAAAAATAPAGSPADPQPSSTRPSTPATAAAPRARTSTQG